MNRRDAHRMDMLVRARQFLSDSAADFPSGIVHEQTVVLTNRIANAQMQMGAQSAGMSDARFMFDGKATMRENLREMLSDIVETARSMVYQFPGVDLKFRMPRNNNDADLLATAQGFVTNATPLEDDFIHYGMDAEFLGALTDLIVAFQQATSATGSPTDSHVAATENISEEIRQGLTAVRTVDAPVRNKYRSNKGKLMAWESASHAEREPRAATNAALKKKTDADKDDKPDA